METASYNVESDLFLGPPGGTRIRLSAALSRQQTQISQSRPANLRLWQHAGKCKAAGLQRNGRQPVHFAPGTGQPRGQSRLPRSVETDRGAPQHGGGVRGAAGSGGRVPAGSEQIHAQANQLPATSSNRHVRVVPGGSAFLPKF